ncbi:MAG: hypothetical protein V7K41_22270 [Nostoc sp.]|uniref:hypothetical protein n=1 Tax=Nostoc sp. TaxID=1180 RepID=UPI002FFA1145
MNNNIKIIAATPQSPSIAISLESTGIFLGILVSVSLLAGVGIKLVSNFNKIASDIRDLKDDLKNHCSTEGHEKVIQQVKLLQTEFNAHDKMLGVHLMNFENRKEAVQFLFGQMDQKIDHKCERWDNELKELKIDVKEVQGFLRKHESFVIRNRQD